MTAAAPRISVILPVYNAARYLARAVDSILAQSFTDFELLALEDGSIDESADILRTYAAQDSRVRILGGDHRGLCHRLNEGIASARGAWLARMDADDIARPDRFDRQWKLAGQSPEIVAIGGGFLLIDDDDDPICTHLPAATHAELVEGLLAGYGSQLCHPAVLLRRDAVQQVGGYRTEYESAEDVDLFLRLAEVGRLAAVPAIMLHYRRHLRSMSLHQRTRQQAAHDAAVRAGWASRGREMPAAVQTRLEQLKRRAACPTSLREMREEIVWLARQEGHTATARKHARRLLRENWHDRRAWRLWLQCRFGQPVAAPAASPIV